MVHNSRNSHFPESADGADGTIFRLNVKEWYTQFLGGAFPRPNVSDAVLAAEYSMDYEQGLMPKSRKFLRTYRSPKVGSDLSQGFPEGRPHVRNNVVLHVLEHPEVCGIDLNEHDVVCGRKCLTDLVKALNVKYSFHIFARKTAMGPVDMWCPGRGDWEPKGNLKKWIEAGLRFEDVATGKGSSSTRKGKYYALVKRTIGDSRILLCAEMDGCENPRTVAVGDSMSNFIELKAVRRRSYLDNPARFYKYRGCGIWTQCFIAGIDKIVYGWFNDDRRLLNVEGSTTSQLYQRSMKSLDHFEGPRWNKEEILTFLECILRLIRRHCEQNPGRVIRISFYGKERCFSAHLEPIDNIEEVTNYVGNVVDTLKRRESRSLVTYGFWALVLSAVVVGFFLNRWLQETHSYSR